MRKAAALLTAALPQNDLARSSTGLGGVARPRNPNIRARCRERKERSESSFTTHQHVNGHTKHKTFTPRTHHTLHSQHTSTQMITPSTRHSHSHPSTHKEDSRHSHHTSHTFTIKRGSPRQAKFSFRHPRTPDRRSAQDSRSGAGTGKLRIWLVIDARGLRFIKLLKGSLVSATSRIPGPC